MTTIAVDPGTEESAYIVYRDGEIIDKDILENDEMRLMLEQCFRAPNDKLAIEMVASYGMPVGKDVFETVLWIGRFIEAWGGPYKKVYRKDVKLHLCKSMKAKDANIRQAIIDRYPPIGGGKTPQIGIKDQPGPLYGMKSHLWSALAVAITSTQAA